MKFNNELGLFGIVSFYLLYLVILLNFTAITKILWVVAFGSGWGSLM